MEQWEEKTVSISEIEHLLDDYEVEIDSEDGFVPVLAFVDKGEWSEYKIIGNGIPTISVNENHLFECERGWVLTKDMLPSDKILREDGLYHSVVVHRTGKRIPIVDLTVDHENHRYYADGYSSHNTNTGKSAMMCFLAGEFLKEGKDVVYISMEMGEELIHERIEANLLDMNTDDIKKLSKKQYLGKLSAIKEKTKGRLYAKEYPTSGAHVGHFRHFLKELKQKKKVKPDVIFIDYINICASSRYKSLSGVNSYSYIKAIAEELRGLAVEMDLPIMTATQINRGGMNEASPDMTSTSESFGLPATLDFFIAQTTDEVLQENDQQLLHLLKTRWGNKAKIKPQLINIDWGKMRYSDVGTQSNSNVQEVQSSVGTKKPKKKEAVADIDWD